MFECCILLLSYINSMCNDGHLLTLKIMFDRFQFRSSKQMFMHLSVTSIEKLLRKKFHCVNCVSGEFVRKHYTIRHSVTEEQFHVFLTLVLTEWGTAVAQWLRCCVKNRKVAGSIPAGVTGIFH